MAIRKTTAERISDTQVRLEHYENQMKLLLQERKQQERKERTRRLIERGAILESLIEKADTLTNEQVKLFLEMTVQTADAKMILKELLPPEKPEDGTDAPAQGGDPAAPSPTTVAQSSGTATAPKSATTPQGAAPARRRPQETRRANALNPLV